VILFSAALAFAIAALLILIAGWALAKVYLVMWSMVIAVLAAVCLLIGALVKRHLLFPAGGRAADGPDLTPQGSSSVSQLAHAGAPAISGAPGHPVTTPTQAPPGTHHGALPPTPFPPRQAGATAPLRRSPAHTGRPLGPEDIVLVVPGRRRFHVANCRQLMGREVEELTYEEAREEGFSPCTTCLPELSPRVVDEPPQPRPTRRQGPRAEAGPTRPAGATGGRDTTDPKVTKDPVPADDTVTVHHAVSARDAAPAKDSATGGDVPGSSAGSDTARRRTASEQPRPEQSRTEKTPSETAASGTGGTEKPQLDWFQRNMLPPTSSGADSRPTPPEQKAAGSPVQSEQDGKGDWFSAARSRPAAAQPGSSSSESSTAGSGRAEKATTAGSENDAVRGAETGGSRPRTAEPESAKKPAATGEGAKTESAAPKSAEPRSPEAESPEPEGAGRKAAEANRAEPESGSPKSAGRETARPESVTAKAADTPSTGKSRSDTANRGDDVTGTTDAEPETAAEITQPGRAGFRPIPASPGSAPGSASQGASAAGSPDAPAAAPAGRPASTSSKAGAESASGPVRPAGDAAGRASGDAKDGASTEDRAGNGDKAKSEDRAATTVKVTAKDSDAEGPAKDATKETAGDTAGVTAKDSGEDTVDKAAAGRGEKGPRDADAVDARSAELEDDDNTNTFAAIRPGTARRVAPGSVKVMVGTRRYHSSECPLISGIDDDSIEVMTKEDAEQAGLTHCSVCQTR